MHHPVDHDSKFGFHLVAFLVRVLFGLVEHLLQLPEITVEHVLVTLHTVSGRQGHQRDLIKLLPSKIEQETLFFSGVQKGGDQMIADRLNDFRLTIFRFAFALRDSFDFGFSRIRQNNFQPAPSCATK